MIYRKIHGMKYQLLETMAVDLPYDFKVKCRTYFAALEKNKMILEKGFVWDGPSGPTIDTKDSLKGSAVHDTLYAMIEQGLLSGDWRDEADDTLEKVCVADGMNPRRASVWEKMVNVFGGMWMKIGKTDKVYSI